VLFFLHDGRRLFAAAGGCSAIGIPRPEEFLTLSVARNQSHSDGIESKQLFEINFVSLETGERCGVDGELTASVAPSGAGGPLYIGAGRRRELGAE